MNPETSKSLEETVRSISDQAEKPRRRGAWRISKNFSTSFYYAFKGIIYGFLSQSNFRIQVFLGIFTFFLGIWLQIDLAKLAIIVFTVALVLILELINTAIEAAVDLSIGRRFHPLARIAKDCSAGAVLLAAMASVLVAILLLLPQLLIRFGI
tara:strand:+ start:672 stop:1130 length:459 start_codon:yes stop_codon:yes gene_type:complete